MHSTSIVTNKMSYCQFMMKFKCKLQRLFEMCPFRTDTGTKSRTPLIDRVVGDALIQGPDCPTRLSQPPVSQISHSSFFESSFFPVFLGKFSK